MNDSPRRHCTEVGCRVVYEARNADPEGRCPKCAAYHRGRTSEAGRAHDEWVATQRSRRKQKRRRKANGVDMTEGREQHMRERARFVNDLLEGEG